MLTFYVTVLKLEGKHSTRHHEWSIPHWELSSSAVDTEDQDLRVFVEAFIQAANVFKCTPPRCQMLFQVLGLRR